MGTRADYYLGRGKDATWLGSTGMDGDPGSVREWLHLHPGTQIASESDWRESVAVLLDENDGTVPEDGWPWPWDNSATTDYAYAWDEGKVWVSQFGLDWLDLIDVCEDRATWPDWDASTPKQEFPDLSAIRNIRWDSGYAPLIIGVDASGRMGVTNPPKRS